MIGNNLVCAICKLEPSTKGCVCDGNIILLGSSCWREHVTDLTMDHNLVDLDLALRMQENPSKIEEYKNQISTLQSKIQQYNLQTQEKINEYGVYKVLELLNIAITYDQVYSSIDITKLTVLNLENENIDDSQAKILARIELNTLPTLDLSSN
jgi:hypothetical protein